MPQFFCGTYASVLGGKLGIKIIDINGSTTAIDTGLKAGMCFLWMGSSDQYTNIFAFQFEKADVTDVTWNSASFDKSQYIEKTQWSNLKLKKAYKAIVIGLK